MNYKNRNKGVRYNGSKGKCTEITRIVNSLLRPGDLYWEPFLGAAKIMQGVRWEERFGSDADPNIVGLLNAVQAGWEPPSSVSEDEYKLWMSRRKTHVGDPMLGFVGYGCSFGARYFQGYARSKEGTVNFAASARTALLRQKPFLAGVKMFVDDYRNSSPYSHQHVVIYCDPPYEGTKPVGADLKPFDSAAFWEWAKVVARAGHTVLVSEYKCPFPDAAVVWQKSVAAGIRFGTGGDGGDKGDGTRKTEKLFLLNPKSARGIGLGLRRK
jgi:DNA adenine methylase